MQDYDFILLHIPRKTNTKVDILTKKDQVNTKEDNKDVQLLKEELWSRRMTADIIIIRRKTITDKCDKIKEIRRNNTREKKVFQALKKEDGVVYMEGRIYVPNSKKIREEILEKNHNLVDIEHSGQQRMLELIKRNY